MKRLLFVVLLLIGLTGLLPMVASAHTATTTCSLSNSDLCTHVLPHDSNCLTSYSQSEPSLNLTDKNGVVLGYLKMFYSYTCGTEWATVNNISGTKLTQVRTHTVRSANADESAFDYYTYYPTPGSWSDGFMVGMEGGENPPDCSSGYVTYTDEYGIGWNVGTSPSCATRLSTQVGNNYGATIETKGNNYFTDAAAADMQNVGLGWVRPQVYESTLETSPGVYNWSLMDTVVANAKAHNLHIDYALQHFHTESQYGELDTTCGLPTPQAEVDFVTALLNHYGSGVFSSLEVGNEEWSFAGKSCSQMESLYAPVLEAASAKIRSYNYGILVGMYGFTGYNSMTPITTFFSALASDPTHPLSYIDYTNIHFYHDGEDPNYVDSKGQPALMDILNNIHTLTAGTVSIPTWVTEYGWCTNQNFGSTCSVVSPDTQSTYINEVLTDMVNHPTIFGKEFLYTMDAGTSPDSITQNGVPLPAYGMMQNFIASHP